MAISEKEKKELMNRIDKRLNNEKSNLFEKIGNKEDSSILFNMVRQFKKALQEDFEKIEDIDEELNNFFAKKIDEIFFMEKIVYKLDPKIFVNEVDDIEKNVLNRYDICVRKSKSKKDIANNYILLNNEMANLKSFISMFENIDLMNNDIIRNKIVDSQMFIDEYEKKINDLKTNNIKVSSNKNELRIANDSSDLNNLKRLSLYLTNLSSAKKSISNGDSKKELFVDGVLLLLKDLSSYVSNSDFSKKLDDVENDLLTKFGYDINNNVLIKNKAKVSNGNDVVNRDNNTRNMSTEEYNRYIALASTIRDYIVGVEGERGTILNSIIHGDSNLYEKNSKELSLYVNKLKILEKEATDVTRSFDDINNDFKNIRKEIKNKFGYEYKSGVKNRKRGVVNVKKLALGIGGFAIGAYGFSRLIKEALFFSKFGFLFGSFVPFVVPTLLSLISVVMLKRAFSKDEKGIIIKFFDKLRNKKDEDDLLVNNNGNNNVKRR